MPLIVDGNLCYTLIRELKEKNQWASSVDVVPIPFNEAKNYRDIQTNHKNYTKFQLAIFGAYNHWDELEKIVSYDNSKVKKRQVEK